eukprot:267059-Chlamydomonas_euryale.AAC.1
MSMVANDVNGGQHRSRKASPETTCLLCLRLPPPLPAAFLPFPLSSSPPPFFPPLAPHFSPAQSYAFTSLKAASVGLKAVNFVQPASCGRFTLASHSLPCVGVSHLLLTAGLVWAFHTCCSLSAMAGFPAMKIARQEPNFPLLYGRSIPPPRPPPPTVHPLPFTLHIPPPPDYNLFTTLRPHQPCARTTDVLSACMLDPIAWGSARLGQAKGD